MAPRITSPIETIERKGGGLTAVINSKFLTNATLFTDNVSNAAEHRLCTLCVSADYKNVRTYVQFQQHISKPP